MEFLPGVWEKRAQVVLYYSSDDSSADRSLVVLLMSDTQHVRVLILVLTTLSFWATTSSKCHSLDCDGIDSNWWSILAINLIHWRRLAPSLHWHLVRCLDCSGLVLRECVRARSRRRKGKLPGVVWPASDKSMLESISYHSFAHLYVSTNYSRSISFLMNATSFFPCSTTKIR